MAYEFLYKGQAHIFKNRDLFVCSRKENKYLIDASYINSSYELMNCSLDEFVLLFEKLHIIRLNRENWANSKYDCSFCLKNNCYYHLKTLAKNKNLIETHIQYKNVVIYPKNKRGRKSKAKFASLKNLD